MPITNYGEYLIALGEVDALILEEQRSHIRSERLDALFTEVEAYEKEHFQIAKPTPEELAAFRREQES